MGMDLAPAPPKEPEAQLPVLREPGEVGVKKFGQEEVGIRSGITTFSATKSCFSRPDPNFSIVHESETYQSRVVLLRVPMTSDESRSMLRIYDLSGLPNPAVLIRLYGRSIPVERIITLQSPPPMASQPNYAQIPLDSTSFPEILPALPGETVRIEIEALGNLKLWAMASTTDNATSVVRWRTPK